MTVDDISRYAYADEMPNTTMTCPEMLLWYQLRDIYELVKSGRWTRGQGQKAKDTTVKSFELHQRLYDSYINLWKRIEYAGTRYAAERTIETADEFYRAVYGINPGAPDRTSAEQEET